ncbi:MAG TPA: cold shock domain-containing protein [Thermoanaerobaculia bacterium]|nr:cold shock domain-containing protein [Thermoanaerobaculia bacterium]
MTARTYEPAAHETRLVASRGVVENLFPSEDYGLLRTEDGRELVFRRENVDGEFDRLNLGSEVSFREELTEDGPEAVDVTHTG